MDEMMETVGQLTELIGALEKKVVSLDKKTDKLALEVKDLNSKLLRVSGRLDIAEKDISDQKKNIFGKIDTIYNQIKELKTLVYEAGLVVVGPDRIQQLEKIMEEKKKLKAKSPKIEPPEKK